MAKVIWKDKNTVSGIEPLTELELTLPRNRLFSPPHQPFPSPKAIE